MCGEMVDAQDLGSCIFGCSGSNPDTCKIRVKDQQINRSTDLLTNYKNEKITKNMNDLLLKTVYEHCIKYIKYGFEALDSDRTYLPPQLGPNAMRPRIINNAWNAWDEWENDQYIDQMMYCSAKWSRILALCRRIRKLEKNRLINPNYYNKSTRNLHKYINKPSYKHTKSKY